jgi:SAM-dependent methyltransferase
MSAIIRRRSTNRRDVREVALDGLDLSFVRTILDLGCGFGFMAGPLAARVSKEARFIGVDAWAANEASYLQNIADHGRSGVFECMRIETELPWPDAGFDLVVCSYSLYFFVDIIPEIARVLSRDGVFLTITHSEAGVVDGLPDAGLGHAACGLLALVRRFSAENGRDYLSRWFGEVVRVDYANSLRFGREHRDELLTYLRFKMPFLVPGSTPEDDLPADLLQFVETLMSRNGEVIVDKSDAAFRCRRPQCH